jgi:hypothetical protein
MKKRNIVISLLVFLMLIVTYAASKATRIQESKGECVDDPVITNKVKTLLGADVFFNSFEISVETYTGTVQLSGFFNSQNVWRGRRLLLEKTTVGVTSYMILTGSFGHEGIFGEEVSIC